MSNQAIQGAIFKRMTSGVAGPIEKALNFDPIKDSTMHGKVLDSQSGVCLKGIRVKQSGTYVQMTPENEKDSLFHKLGFNVADLVRDLGSVNGRIGQAHPPYTLAQERAYPRPITTCAFVGAAEFQSLSLNRAGMPLYDAALKMHMLHVNGTLSRVVKRLPLGLIQRTPPCQLGRSCKKLASEPWYSLESWCSC